MVLTTDVDRLEALYAQGQKVKAIHECREIAIRALPGHAARLQTELDKHTNTLPGYTFLIETFLYLRNTYEDANAATVVVWCAKWLVGMDDTRTEYELGSVRKTPIGDIRERISRTVVIRGREDFAANAFIALRLMATPGKLESANLLIGRQDQRLARLRELGGVVILKNGATAISGIKKLVDSEVAAGAAARTEKTVRADLKAAYERELDAKRSGIFPRSASL